MTHRWMLVLVAAALSALLVTGCGSRAARASASGDSLERSCVRHGWQEIELQAAGLQRRVMWKAPRGAWKNGAILVLHGGGGQADHFCAGGRMVDPQIEFAEKALERGFAVFALDASTDQVTDAQGRACGRRFDFSVMPRANLDLPYVEKVIGEIVPGKRPVGSHPAVFVTGLSTGGYMTTRIAAELGERITAFAPVSAGDPYGTDAICDPKLSERTAAKGILVDRETRKEIVEDGACASASTANESPWPPAKGRRPAVRQFHHEDDGIVDLWCMRKATAMLERNGFPAQPPFVITKRGGKDPLKHLWMDEYNSPLLDFFASQAAKGG